MRPSLLSLFVLPDMLVVDERQGIHLEVQEIAVRDAAVCGGGLLGRVAARREMQEGRRMGWIRGRVCGAGMRSSPDG